MRMKRIIPLAMASLLLISSTEILAASGLLTQGTYRRLMDIQELVDEKQYDQAIKEANGLLGDIKNDYEEAMVLQRIAYIYIYKEDYPSTIKYLEKALAKNAFSKQEEQATTIALAQTYLTQDNYKKVISLLDSYLKSNKELPPDAYILGAIAYTSLNQYREALPYAKKAIELSAKPNKDWHQLLLSIYYELNQYPNAAALLETMITYWPDEGEFWRNLASVYLELQDDDKALATLSLAYDQGMLVKEPYLLNLARLYILSETPYKAGLVISKGIDDKYIEANVKNLELLGTAWTQAREYEKAAEALGQAGAKSDNGDLYLRQARLYASMHKWDDVVTAVDNAMEKGDLKDPGAAYILQGMAAVEEDKYDKALVAFRKAEKFEDSEDQAKQWIRYVETDLLNVAQAAAGR